MTSLGHGRGRRMASSTAIEGFHGQHKRQGKGRLAASHDRAFLRVMGMRGGLGTNERKL